MWSELKQEILTWKRQFFIDVQAQLLDTIISLATKYPVPTHDNVEKKNSHILLDMFEEFEKYNEARQDLFRGLKRLVIGKYEADDWYSERGDWFLVYLFNVMAAGEWELPVVDSPTTHWSDPEAMERLALARIDIMLNKEKVC